MKDVRDCEQNSKYSVQLVKDLLFLNPDYKEDIEIVNKDIENLSI